MSYGKILPIQEIVAVTPDTPLNPPLRGINSAEAGVIFVDTLRSTNQPIYCAAGAYYPAEITRIRSAGTTVTNYRGWR